jgi:hypothetical protein
MPAQLGSSDAIDRGGSGETPDVGSTFTLVPAIPRGPALQYKWFGEFKYYGGPPRCPRCRKSTARIHFTGSRRSKVGGSFHCIACLVCWFDTREVTCYVCDEPYTASVDKHLRDWNTCHHLNRTDDPFCPKCTAIIGTDNQHRRRKLRRMVGLR